MQQRGFGNSKFDDNPLNKKQETALDEKDQRHRRNVREFSKNLRLEAKLESLSKEKDTSSTSQDLKSVSDQYGLVDSLRQNGILKDSKPLQPKDTDNQEIPKNSEMRHLSEQEREQASAILEKVVVIVKSPDGRIIDRQEFNGEDRAKFLQAGKEFDNYLQQDLEGQKIPIADYQKAYKTLNDGVKKLLGDDLSKNKEIPTKITPEMLKNMLNELNKEDRGLEAFKPDSRNDGILRHGLRGNLGETDKSSKDSNPDRQQRKDAINILQQLLDIFQAKPKSSEGGENKGIDLKDLPDSAQQLFKDLHAGKPINPNDFADVQSRVDAGKNGSINDMLQGNHEAPDNKNGPKT
jgi:bacterioferritin (cytochrome b1)